MQDRDDSLIECANRELEEPHTPEGLRKPRAIFAVLFLVIVFLVLVGTCGRL